MYWPVSHKKCSSSTAKHNKQDFFRNSGLCMNPRIIIVITDFTIHGRISFNNLEAKKVTLILVLQHE